MQQLVMPMMLQLVTTQQTFHPPAVKRLEATRRLLESHSGLLLVDGNNVRAATGFRYTAREMNACLDAWADRSRVAERTIIYWDHGPQPASFRLASGSAVLLSGNDQTADDVIVKSCGYLVGAADLCVVTSDQALRGRCRTQRIEAPTSAATTSLEMLHGIYLSWLLESDEQLGWRGSAELIDRYASPHRCRTETTSQRAQQAQELFEELARLAAPTAAPLPSGSPTSLSAQLASWYQGGCDGLGVSRASRRGNPVYSYQHTLAL